MSFERQCQYSLLSGRLEADQRRVCELQRSGTAPLVSTLTSTLTSTDVTHVTLSPRPRRLPPPFLHTVCDQKLEAGTAWERGYPYQLGINLTPRPYSGVGPLHYLWLVSYQMRSGNETNLWLDLAETLDHDHTLVC